MTDTAPYGSWLSPISAAALVASGHPVSGGCYVGDDIWWLEARPAEQGRLAIRRRSSRSAGSAGSGARTDRSGAHSGVSESSGARTGSRGAADRGLSDSSAVVDVLPAPWNARTRVHEYGGGAWTATPDGTLVFAEFSDQRLYRLDPGRLEPTPLTPAYSGMRFADLSIVGDDVLAVRETHGENGVERDIVAVPLDGSASIRSLVSGSRFLAYPRMSPDGSRLAWIAWEHPQLPWDGTELRVGTLRDGIVDEWTTVMGGVSESVLQPEWTDAGDLYAVSDRTGWWNLYRLDPADPQPEALHPLSADFGGPLWTLGMRFYSVLADGRLLCTRSLGTDTLGLLDPRTGRLDDLAIGLDSIQLADVSGDRVLLVGGSATLPSGLRELRLSDGGRELRLSDGALRDIRLGVDELPEEAYLPRAEAMTFMDARDVHAFAYLPRNPDYTAPAGELPPFVAVVHGGPTSRSVPALRLDYAFFTSRGIGVIDINYGGSTGYGREYRNRLRGQWGVVDVEDTIAAVRGLAEAGIADPGRLAIRGASAGGWTVLCALTSSDVFACGVSYFGVADLSALAEDTHDFESRYLDGLVGPLPEAADLYRDRAPINRLDRLSCPVLLLQGLEDPIVPPAQAESFRDAMVGRGIRHAYVAYEGESHGFRKAETIIHSIQAELSFYGQVMGFETPDVPELSLWTPSVA